MAYRFHATALGTAAAMGMAIGPVMPVPAVAQGYPATLETSAGALSVTRVADFASPWGAAFLPDGSMLVTRKSGTLHRVTSDGAVSRPIRGVPEVHAVGQGGLLDVALSPDFARDRMVYLTFSESRRGGAATAAGRGRLNEAGDRLQGFEVIFRQQPAVQGRNHFGSRLAFAPDGHLFVTLGDRFDRMEDAQNPANHIGSVVRVARDGAIPKDNPFVTEGEAKGKGAPETWSYGHRNVQGAAIHPDTGELWISEMGPRGGDEINRPRPGANFGWPLVSHGVHYSGRDIPDPSTRPEFAGAEHFWARAVAPSGITFMTGNGIPAWKGDLIVGALAGRAIVRLDLEGGAIRGEERIDMGLRIRDVIEGPDGALYALTDGPDGMILRISRQD